MERRHGWSVRGPWDTSRFPYGVHGAHGGTVPPDVGLRMLDDWSPGAQAGTLSLDQLMELARSLGVPFELEGTRDQGMYTELREKVRLALRVRTLRAGSQHSLGHSHHPAHTHHRPAVVQDARPAVQQSAAGAAPVAEAPPPAVPQPPTADVAPIVRCRITEFGVTDDKRHPSGKKVLQVVPKPETAYKKGYTGGEGYNKELSERLDKWDEVLKERKKFGSFGEFIKAQKGTKGPGPVESSEKNTKRSSAHYSGGKAKVKVKAAYAPDCGTKHPLVATGAHSISKPGNEATLPFDAPTANGKFLYATPDVYQVKGHGCEGRTDTVRVEVFPSDQYLFNYGIEKKAEVFKHAIEKISAVLKYTGAGSAEVSAQGGFDAFLGWRTEDDGWRAYYAMEVAVGGSLKFEIKFTISFVSMITHVPESLLEYIGDVGVNVGIGLEAGIRGSLTVRRFPGSGDDGKALDVVPGIKLEGKGSIPVEVYAYFGAKSILAAQASGRFEPTVVMEAKDVYEDGRSKFEAKGTLAEGKLTLALMVTALWWERKKEWDFHLWDEKTIYEPGKKFPLFDPDHDLPAAGGA